MWKPKRRKRYIFHILIFFSRMHEFYHILVTLFTQSGSLICNVEVCPELPESCDVVFERNGECCPSCQSGQSKHLICLLYSISLDTPLAESLLLSKLKTKLLEVSAPFQVKPTFWLHFVSQRFFRVDDILWKGIWQQPDWMTSSIQLSSKCFPISL